MFVLIIIMDYFLIVNGHKQDRATQSRVGLETQAFQHGNTIPKWYNHCCYPHHTRISIPYIHAERQDRDTAQVYTVLILVGEKIVSIFSIVFFLTVVVPSSQESKP